MIQFIVLVFVKNLAFFEWFERKEWAVTLRDTNFYADEKKL